MGYIVLARKIIVWILTSQLKTSISKILSPLPKNQKNSTASFFPTANFFPQPISFPPPIFLPTASFFPKANFFPTAHNQKDFYSRFFPHNQFLIHSQILFPQPTSKTIRSPQSKQFTVFLKDWHLRKVHKWNSTFDNAIK